MSEPISDSRIPRLAVGCRVRTVSPDEAMLLVPEGALRLKGAASEIIGLIDGQRSVEAITIELQQKHATTDSSQITAEVKQFLDKLHARSVLLYKD
ncbi:pyrroloquinoline quinone biosynthesis peptide chaperone PqqD [Tunturiibacter gelidoferens]|uniref:Coenzyme PQQ biosynthesis protein PqqD n=3 Tax=Tunturiibacter TaxID=3154218 RepID=A0A7Y9NMZ5_9BACT|nr:pyrroloquinoline quinone biosynthesis peptide chaperone PqqD [Edaphobacter lichenicola]MBB5338410.1 coenzyme PQQ biosynthesis protein PqqD [Edaphobacter lichenicola]NYF52341.1 coenzyme PQQ biosynthesis protein PqqD [Edaphobacter lichenicola]